MLCPGMVLGRSSVLLSGLILGDSTLGMRCPVPLFAGWFVRAMWIACSMLDPGAVLGRSLVLLSRPVFGDSTLGMRCPVPLFVRALWIVCSMCTQTRFWIVPRSPRFVPCGRPPARDAGCHCPGRSSVTQPWPKYAVRTHPHGTVNQASRPVSVSLVSVFVFNYKSQVCTKRLSKNAVQNIILQK